jgi:hypothetical protein
MFVLADIHYLFVATGWLVINNAPIPFSASPIAGYIKWHPYWQVSQVVNTVMHAILDLLFP